MQPLCVHGADLLKRALSSRRRRPKIFQDRCSHKAAGVAGASACGGAGKQQQRVRCSRRRNALRVASAPRALAGCARRAVPTCRRPAIEEGGGRAPCAAANATVIAAIAARMNAIAVCACAACRGLPLGNGRCLVRSQPLLFSPSIYCGATVLTPLFRRHMRSDQVTRQLGCWHLLCGPPSSDRSSRGRSAKQPAAAATVTALQLHPLHHADAVATMGRGRRRDRLI